MNFCGYKIGETRLIDVPQLSGRYGISVAVKDESHNEASGTFKDRRNAYLLQKDDNIEASVWYVSWTSGNSGLSMGRQCHAYSKATGRKRRVLSVIDAGMPGLIKTTLRTYGEVHEVNGSREIIPNNRLDELGREIIGDRGAVYMSVEHANPHSNGYSSLAAELFNESADFWFCPVGEGELMTQLAFSAQQMKTHPKIIGVTVDDNIFMKRGDFRNVGRSVADKLVTPYSDFKGMLQSLCRSYGHEIIQVSDRKIMEEYEILRELGIKAEPSAAAAFAGARKYAKDRKLKIGDRAIIINTGSGIYDIHSTKPARRMHIGMSLLTIGALAGGFHLYNNYAERQKLNVEKDEQTINYLERKKEQFSSEPILADIQAFAEYKGRIEKLRDGKFTIVPDESVQNALEYWYLAQDNIARLMYRDGGQFAQTIDEFKVWRESRQALKEEKTRKAEEALMEFYLKHD